MLELFSKVPDSLGSITEASQLTPIPIEEDVSSLSAILMNSVYYDFISQNIKIIDDLPVTGPEVLIPLKARAWIDLTERKNDGEKTYSI